jgi:hypothetical protein
MGALSRNANSDGILDVMNLAPPRRRAPDERRAGLNLATTSRPSCSAANTKGDAVSYKKRRRGTQQQSAMNAAAMQAFYARQAEIARQNQPRMCSYNGSTIGGITGGTMTCR